MSIPIREFLSFDHKELRKYLLRGPFFENYFNIASPRAQTRSDKPIPIWMDQFDIGVEMCYPLRTKRRVEKKNSTKIDLIYIPIDYTCPRIELCTYLDDGWITIGTIEFMMIPPFLILGIYKGTGKKRKAVTYIKEVE